jgi:hypothetical protein
MHIDRRMRILLVVALATVGCASINKGGGMNAAHAATDAKSQVADTGAATNSVATNGSDTTVSPTVL